jgi:pimeloyl-ACP methyl ester carboxylesterase
MIRRRLALLGVYCAALSGCAPFAMYRSDPNTCTGGDESILNAKCKKSAVQVLQPVSSDEPGYVLGFIEFDDQGQMWSREQMRAVLEGVDAETSGGSTDCLMVAFVHGWKHNAGFKDKRGSKHDAVIEDTNVVNFRHALTQLSATEIELSRKVGRPARKIIGIYLGWRGASITMPFIENFTFWDRKNTAHKVGHGQVTEVLDRLDLIRQQRIDRNPDSRSRLIVVGHSFGGAVVFSALAQILESRFAQSVGTSGPTSPVRGFGNLVVLINPAFEAGLYAPLSDLSTEQSSYAKSQLPVLAILTSEADEATGVAFPIGRWFSTWFEKHREVRRNNPVNNSIQNISQRDADVDAVGHFEPYRTHTLSSAQTALAPSPTTDVAQSARQNARAVATSSQQWEDDAPGSEITFPGSVMKRTLGSAGRDPYLVVKVDKALIADHNDIWRPGIRDFITHLILISSQSGNLTERTEHREAAKK